MSTPNDADLTVMLMDTDPGASMKWSDYSWEDYLTLGIFWLLAIDVFVQFFTRYVLNDSLAWTEEFARYLLMLTGFIGGSLAVRKNSHIMVEFFYRYVGPGTGRFLSTVVDVSRVLFFFVIARICFKLAGKTNQMMVSVDIPKSIIYYIIAAGLFWMGVRAVLVAIRHWRQGGSMLNLSNTAQN